MAKVIKSGKKEIIFPLEKENYIILGVGLVIIILGYIALSGNTVEGFFQLTVAPILLVIGYCVIIPLGIMYKPKARRSVEKKTVEQSDTQAN